MTTRAFPFRVEPATRRWNRLFLVHPEACTVRVGEDRLTAFFGRWSLTTTLDNIVGVAVTGPYQRWKIAAPAHLSLADRGITFGTTAERGVCIAFAEPVPAIEPFGIVRHPNLTLTVADPEEFAAHLVAAVDAARGRQRIGSTKSSDLERANVCATVEAFVRWLRRRDDGSIVHVQRLVGRIDGPTPLADDNDVQTLEDGVGPVFHRRYDVLVGGVECSLAEAMSCLRDHLDVALDDGLSPVTKIAGELGSMSTGDRYLIALAGPWNAPVEAVLVDDDRFRFATLSGHLEAGTIEFRVEDSAGALGFTIESWARNGDHVMRVLYDRIGVARMLQAELWVELCERFVELVDGTQLGAVDVLTERCAD